MGESQARTVERHLERRIRAHMPRGEVQVVLTDNRYTMISVRRGEARGPDYSVRLHHMFAEASPDITRALALYIGKNDSSASRTLGQFIDSHQACIRPRLARSPQLVTEGAVHNIQQIFDELNAAYFENRIEARITWGPRLGKARRRNSIKMGSYSIEERLIRIHRALDREFVPGYFVGWIIYHEMLHQVHGAEVVNGRRRFHTKAFLEDEARYHVYAEARAWERAHLDALLTY